MNQAEQSEPVRNRYPIAQILNDERFLDQEWLLERWSGGFGTVKRAMDLIIASLLFIGFLLSLIPVSLAILTTSRGPVLYRQERVGQDGKPFMVWKYRSMYTDAEKHGARFASKNDPRITAVGAFLRASRMDELPQSINILVGQMSVVGPRPERPHVIEEVAQTIPAFRMRTVVRPGLTGWAQVKGEYAASHDELATKLEYDLYYIRNASIWMDLRAVVETVSVVVKRRGL